MKNPSRSLFYMLLFSGVVLFIILLMQPFEVYTFIGDNAILFPDGWVGLMQRDLLILIQVLMLIFIIPVFILTFVFSWRYRADNKKSKYDPHLVDHKVAEFFWWGIPLVFTIVVAIITGIKTFELDPYKPIKSENKTQEVEVIALQWRWLFLYPEEKIATINYLRIRKDVPVRFRITSDAPMNSLWIPRLGGQIYAMPGMETQLHLIANEEGKFRGSSANISGEGFARMHFVTEATDQQAYDTWIQEVQQSEKNLDMGEYDKLVAPSFDSDVQYFQLGDENLFNEVVMKYMKPQKSE